MGRMENQTLMLREAMQTPAVIALQRSSNRSAIKRIVGRLRAIDPPFIATCARGSSDCAATYAKYLFERRPGLAVCSFAPSIASLYGARLQLKNTAFLAISQSGRSPDLLSAAQSARECGAYVVAIVNDQDSPLAELADDVLPILAGDEHSVAATKSCLGAMAAIFDLRAEWLGDTDAHATLDGLPEALDAALQVDWSHAIPQMRGIRQAFVISRGTGFAGVQEAALKLKETCKIQAEAFSAAEVKHGPMAVVDEGFPVIAASTLDAAQAGIDDVMELFLERGAKVFSAGSPLKGAISMPLPVAPSRDLQPLVFLQAFYRFANSLSLARGFDPDNPKHLKKVTETV